MALADFSIRRPVFSWMLFIGAVLFGTISFLRLGVSQMPDADFPVVNIGLTLEGAAPEIMETDVVDPIESSVLSIEGVQTITSSSRNGSASVTIEFALDKNIDTAMQEVQNRITQIQRTLPADIDPPTISKVNPEDQPIMWLGVSSDKHSLKELMVWVRDNIKDRFSTTAGVGDIQMGGFIEPNLRVWLDSKKLATYDIAATDVISAIRNQHSEVPAGTLENDKQESNVRTMGEARSPEEFGQLLINQRGGAPREVNVKMSSIARVEDGLADIRQMSRTNGKIAVGLGIKKQRGSNAVEVAKNVLKRMDEINKTLPEGMTIGSNFDSTRFIKASIGNLNHELLMAALLTGVVCWFFLGSFSSTVNILLAIPFSIVGAFTALYFCGFTLNTFTLLAITMSIGIVVDDAIMMLENIFRHKEMGKSRIRAAFDGAREITPAATVTTIAIVAIFVPVVFMEGIIGKFFLQFGIALTVTVMLSLLEALTLTPSRCSQFLDTKPRTDFFGKRIEAGLRWLESAYRGTIPFLLRNRWKVLAVSVMFFIGSLGLTRVLKKEFTPAQDQGIFIARAQTPVGSSFEYTDAKMKELETYISKHPALERYYLSIGGGPTAGSVNQAFLFMTLKLKGTRPKNPATGREYTQNDVMNDFRKDLNQVKDVFVTIQDLSSRGFSGSGRGFPVEFTIVGRDWDKLAELSKAMMDKMSASGLVTDVDTDYKVGMPEVHITPDREKAAARGVSTIAIGQTVQALIGGVKAGRYTQGSRRYDVRVRLEATERDRAEAIKNLFVRNNYGELVRLSDVVKIESKPMLQSVSRQNRQRAISVFANVAKTSSQEQALAFVQKAAKETLPPEYNLVLSGAAQTSQNSFKSLLVALFLGIAVAYMVLASQFNSFIHPVTILSALPFSVSGAFLALLVTGNSLNMYSMIALLLLMGIVKKNSILLVEFTNQMRERNPKLGVSEALMEACPVRLRPILMTSFATIAGAVPGAIGLGEGSETTRPMAAALIGGLLVSTILTLFVVPVIYSLFSRLERSHAFQEELAEAEKEDVSAPALGSHGHGQPLTR
jgi:HAE1 family hydrophobic/amphiphilic exporter-1